MMAEELSRLRGWGLMNGILTENCAREGMGHVLLRVAAALGMNDVTLPRCL